MKLYVLQYKTCILNCRPLLSTCLRHIYVHIYTYILICGLLIVAWTQAVLAVWKRHMPGMITYIPCVLGTPQPAQNQLTHQLLGSRYFVVTWDTSHSCTCGLYSRGWVSNTWLCIHSLQRFGCSVALITWPLGPISRHMSGHSDPVLFKMHLRRSGGVHHQISVLGHIWRLYLCPIKWFVYFDFDFFPLRPFRNWAHIRFGRTPGTWHPYLSVGAFMTWCVRLCCIV